MNEFEEFLTCARYGELDNLQLFYNSYNDSFDKFLLYRDPSSLNTSLHMAAANDHLGNHIEFI